jgi:hypothetical protein
MAMERPLRSSVFPHSNTQLESSGWGSLKLIRAAPLLGTLTEDSL